MSNTISIKQPPILWFSTLFLFAAVLILSCGKSEVSENLVLEGVFIGSLKLSTSSNENDVPIDQNFDLHFSSPIETNSAGKAISLSFDNKVVSINFVFLNDNKSVRVVPSDLLENNTVYELAISKELQGLNNEVLQGSKYTFTTIGGSLKLLSFEIDGFESISNQRSLNVSVTPVFDLQFSRPIDRQSIKNQIQFNGKSNVTPEISFLDDDTKVQIITNQNLKYLARYELTIKDEIQGINGEKFYQKNFVFHTSVDESPKFPQISNEDLMTKVQKQTFNYFWDFAHETSGLARERNSSVNTVTTGGSGFGLMAMIVAVERGFISRDQAILRWKKVFNFLESADRFHGVWPHWLNGSTGKVVPFSARDNGGDIVETAFLIQGMLTVRQYLDPSKADEMLLISQINKLWNEVEWDWFTKNNTDAMYWHWSPDQGWAINLKISGHNETQIAYILAASSTKYGIDKPIYEKGYAKNGNIQNGNSYFNIELPLGSDKGGPLFFTHYSYLGLDPRNLKDSYADYWEQNTNHTLINRAYCISNPHNYVLYSQDCWGLTASDNHEGYSAHHPNNDKGVITPTAAISSMPYTPKESMEAMRYFYYVLGDKLWGEYGFYDAFNPTEDWTAGSYLAIDQGPIICMIENHRTGLLWDLFMSAPEIKNGLDKLGFTF